MDESVVRYFLWRFLESEGYTVCGEIKVFDWALYSKLSRNIKEKKKLGKPLTNCENRLLQREERLRKEENTLSSIDNEAFYKQALEKYHRRHARKFRSIDIVALRGIEYVGVEVKGSFNQLATDEFLLQLLFYRSGGMLDNLYLALPQEIYENVAERDGGILEDEGVGIISVSNIGRVRFETEALRLERSDEPKMERKEVWLKQKLHEYFDDRGFGIEEECEVTGGKIIDLCVVPKESSHFDFFNIRSKKGLVGVEVKLKIGNVENLKNQMNKYLEDKELKKLYIALLKNEGNLRKVSSLKGTIGVLFYTQKGDVEIFRDSPELF